MIPTPILDELQALLEKATPGTAYVGHDGPSRPILHIGVEMLSLSRRDGTNNLWTTYGKEEADCLLFALLRNHAPALIAAYRQLEEVRRDAERLQLIEDECLDVRCYSTPTGGDDFSTLWQVSQHHMGERQPRIIGQHADNLRKALDLAAAQLNGEANGQ